MTRPPDPDFNRWEHAKRWTVLMTIALGVGIIWCSLLPWIATRPATRQRLNFLDQRGIDPSAMFYTELKAMDRILEKIESSHDSVDLSERPVRVLPSTPR